MLDGFQNFIDTIDGHVGGIDEMFQFVQFVPDLPLEDGLRSDSEAITADEICLAFIAEIWIGLQEVLELIFPWLELTVFVFEHADGAACVDDEHLNSYD